MTFWYLIGSLAALLTSFGFVPQIIRMWRTRSVHDISPFMLIQFSIGISLWLIYGIHLGDAIIIAANGVSLLMGLLATGLYFYYKRQMPVTSKTAN